MSDYERQPQSGFGASEAQQLSAVTKSAPQLAGLTSRWLLKLLPWVQVHGGVYQVNRVLNYQLGAGKLVVLNSGGDFRIVPRTLTELPVLNSFPDREILAEISDRFIIRRFQAGETIVSQGTSADHLYVIATGQVALGDGQNETLKRGDYFGLNVLTGNQETWPVTITARTRCIVLPLSRTSFDDLQKEYPTLKLQVEAFQQGSLSQKSILPYSKAGLGTSHIATGHEAEAPLPSAYMDYETFPRRYELSVAQTILRIQSRVADLYNEPMNQTEQQIRLTLESLRERQEWELLNNEEFGLLPNAEFEQCLSAEGRVPTPDDFDNLITRQRGVEYLVAHPKAIAAFGKECTRQGIYPQSVEWGGVQVPAWRGVPVFPSKYIPIDPVKKTTAVLALRTGETNQGVIGLNQTGIPDEFEPGANVRFMNIDDKAVISYLVSIYYSAAILSPDALTVLEDIVV